MAHRPLARKETHMAGKVKPIPDGYHSITPYLTVKNGGALVEFLQKAFGAAVTHRMDHSDGSLWHADLQIGDSHVMIGGASDQWPERPSNLYLYVEDADAVYRRAVEAGGTSIMEPADMFYGDRQGGVKDPSGNGWWIATHVEDVPAEELERRGKAAAEERKKASAS
jgi:PhnB protein